MTDPPDIMTGDRLADTIRTVHGAMRGASPLQLAALDRLLAHVRATEALTVAALVCEAYRVTVAGKRVAIVPTVETSDVMDVLAGEVDIVAGFGYLCDAGKPKLTVSLRGRGVDVSAIAKRYGGGGHTAAAGFTCDLTATTPHPWICVPNLLRVALVG